MTTTVTTVMFKKFQRMFKMFKHANLSCPNVNIPFCDKVSVGV